VLTYPSDEMFVSILGLATIFVIQFYPEKKRKGSNPPAVTCSEQTQNFQKT